jgi:hypothetical protein
VKEDVVSFVLGAVMLLGAIALLGHAVGDHGERIGALEKRVTALEARK